MIFLYFTAGIAGGIIGGLGMGGGTLLIPILTLALGVNQYSAQAVNLVSFIPMSAVALYIHSKNHLVKTENTAYIILPAVISSVISGFIASSANTDLLKHAFGIFLALLGSVLFIKEIFADKQDEN